MPARTSSPNESSIQRLLLALLIAALFSPSVLAQACVQAPAGLVGWWPGDGYANDIQGNSHAKLWNGSTFANGKVGKAFYMDGIDDEIVIPRSPALDDIRVVTVSLWINMNGAVSGTPGIFAKREAQFGPAGVLQGYGFYFRGDALEYYHGVENNQFIRWVTRPGSFPASLLGQWVHIAVVHDRNSRGNNPILYVNGVAQQVERVYDPGGNLTFDSAYDIYLKQGALRGMIDELQIFNRELTSDEIRGIYEAAQAGVCKGAAPVPVQNACAATPAGVAWWPGEGNANDILGSSHGTPSPSITFGTGLVGQAFDMPLGPNQILVSPNPSINNTLVSFDLWVKPRSFGLASFGAMVEKRNVDGTQGWGLYIRGSASWLDFYSGVENGNIILWTTPPGSFPASWFDEWIHVAAVYDRSSRNNDPQIFINGKPQSVTRASDPGGQLTSDSALDLYLGHYFDGLYDEAELFTRALTPDEIKEIHHTGIGGKCRGNPVPLVTATVRLASPGGSGIPGGLVTYLDPSGFWQPFGTTGGDGSVQKQLPAGTWKFRMSFAGRTQEKVQDIGTPVTFSLVPVQLQFSGLIEYQDDAGLWRPFSKPSMQLLPVGNTLFRFESAGSLQLNVGPAGLTKSIVAARLVNSQGTGLTGGTAQFYLSTWQPCAVAGTSTSGYVLCVMDGLVASTTIGLEYESTRQNKTQNIASNSNVLFQTVNLVVQLKDSAGSPLDTGTVQYYSGAWKSLGTTSGGEARKELLPGSYTFRLIYQDGLSDKVQDIAASPLVVFQTTNVVVQLRDSTGKPLDGGSAMYYRSSWNSFGTTSSGDASKELLPGSYTFRMTYADGLVDKVQNITSSGLVLFQTTNVAAQLKDSAGNPLDVGAVQYYRSKWNDFGTTSGGEVRRELLPGSYTFRMTYADGLVDKVQNVASASLVTFQTTNVTAQLKDSAGSPLGGGAVQYYRSRWSEFGTTSSGEARKELLPGTYVFRMTYEGTLLDKTQNVTSSPLVAFQTIGVLVQLSSSTGAPLDNGTVQYYAGTWRQFGVTAAGAARKELLPGTYTFRVNYATWQADKTQNIVTSSSVAFTAPGTVALTDGGNAGPAAREIDRHHINLRIFGRSNSKSIARASLPRERFSARRNVAG